MAQYEVKATVEVKIGERSLLYEVVEKADKSMQIWEYVDHDRPRILDATFAWKHNTNSGMLQGVSLAGSLIETHFGGNRCSNKVEEILEALGAPPEK